VLRPFRQPAPHGQSPRRAHIIHRPVAAQRRQNRLRPWPPAARHQGGERQCIGAIIVTARRQMTEQFFNRRKQRQRFAHRITRRGQGQPPRQATGRGHAPVCGVNKGKQLQHVEGGRHLALQPPRQRAGVAHQHRHAAGQPPGEGADIGLFDLTIGRYHHHARCPGDHGRRFGHEQTGRGSTCGSDGGGRF
jgi:hypothetical protein